MKLIDVTGQRFGRLVAIKRAKDFPHPTKTIPQWLCECDCGRKATVIGYNLRKGLTASCGCLRRELSQRRFVTHGYASAGDKRSAEYTAWAHMLQRCENKNDCSYHLYGGRGIKVCKAWHSFESFLTDMGHRPSKKHSVERKNNSLGYNRENCVWAMPVTQSNNRRSNRTYLFKGQRLTMRQILLETGSTTKYTTVKARLDRGLSIEDAIIP
jgi:hypothetical protein